MCNRLNKYDHYYGAFLSKVLDNGNRPALMKKDEGRGIYKLATDKSQEDYLVYMKYVSNKKGDNLWNFNFTDSNLREIEELLKTENLIFGLIGSYKSLNETEIAIVSKDEFLQCIDFNCSRNKNQRLSVLKKKGSSKLYIYGTFLDRDDAIGIERYRINEL